MWLCVDRIENTLVVLVSDEDNILRLPVADYVRLTGKPPAESDILQAEVVDGRILSAAFDPTETAARKAAVRTRLNRLFGKE